MFNPIAIIGRACLLPSALTPEQLWKNRLTGKDCLSDATAQTWGMDPAYLLEQGNVIDKTWTSRCGYVQGFEAVFDPNGFFIPARQILQWDVVCQWLLHTGRQALKDAGYSLKEIEQQRAGTIIGNLSYPTQSLSRFSEAVWLSQQHKNTIHPDVYQQALACKPHPDNRFMSGLPIYRMAQGLGLTGEAFAIDAACASSFYAIKLACDQLQTETADIMLAGGINAADSLFLQMGFSVLQALSKTGKSLPLHRHADGLIPAQGVAIVALKRLEDAIRDQHLIYGVIRGIGLSNDGTDGGLLVPREAGQVAAIKQAYETSQLNPDDISWIECHATGTPLGDSTEIHSMQRIFNKASSSLDLGVLKENIGHSITASGAAALINVLSAFRDHLKPPSRSASYPSDALRNSHFRLLEQTRSWDTSTPSRYAAINCFGFGGNNAHLIVEEWSPNNTRRSLYHSKNKPLPASDIAIIGLGVLAGNVKNKIEFAQVLWGERTAISEYCPNQTGGYIETISLPIQGLPFPPADLKCTLGQQLALLQASQEALEPIIKKVDPHRTAVLIGMQCDAEIARMGLRWRLPLLLLDTLDAATLSEWRDLIHLPLEPAHIVGCMPNIVTNRINKLLNFKAPSYSILAEELSGVTAMQIALLDLQHRQIDMAVVGAVDLCCETVHQQAARAVLQNEQHLPGDAAVVLVLKRLADAKEANETIYGVIPAEQITHENASFLRLSHRNSPITQAFGHAHAASGLLHIAAAILACHEKLLISSAMKPLPWLANQQRAVNLSLTTFLGKETTLQITEEKPQQTRVSLLTQSIPRLFIYSGIDKNDILKNLKINPQEWREKAQSIASATFLQEAKLILVAHDVQELTKQQQLAIHYLNQEMSVFPQGIYFYEKPIGGELAFVFTGALTTYPKMGQKLIAHWPQLLAELTKEVKSLSDITNRLYQLEENNASLTMLEELKTYSFLAQVHAQFTQRLLEIKPHACIGYCSGETNALIALKAWRDMEALFLDVEKSNIYTDSLSGQYTVLNNQWQTAGNKFKWSTFRVFANVDMISDAIKTETHVRLTIINSPNDCVIAGDPEACIQFFKKIPHLQTKTLPHSMVIHCQEFHPLSQLWRKLHYRQTYPIKNVRFYSAGSGRSYAANADHAADALLSQAANTVNFPRIIQQAWQDGIRVFVEHGPRNLCSKWINDILGEKKHLAIPLDIMGMNSLTQAAYATAQLIAAGVTAINIFTASL
ncbi:MAG TPA: beta-ketoacyl synthase N-terminal-like domain-containing protein [Gammaproteobacteria bacterium]|nr:beta-ketoacyl synthase N-terminal-like domain-containing protein [Gammaproteobacteria bacterium]